MEGYNDSAHCMGMWRKHIENDTLETQDLAADRNAARNRLDSITKTNMKHTSIKEAPPWNGPQTKPTKSLNMVSGTNLTLSSDVDHNNSWKTNEIFHKVWHS